MSERETGPDEARTVPGDVLSALGHELRGHLGVTRGYLRLLAQDADLGGRQARAVQEASRAADRMAALLDEVSELGRWVRGEVVLARTPVALAPLLRDATRGVTPDPDLPTSQTLTVQGHADHLRQAFAALAEATARALQDHGPMAIEAGPEAGRPGLRFTFTAAGAPPASLEERPPDLRRSGLGLRLVLAEAIIRAHGGSLGDAWLDGRWSGFIVRL